VRCSACNNENREGRRFCAQCGASLALACPSCGAAYEAGERFCGDCGKPLTEGASPTQATPTPQPVPALPASFAGGRYVVKRYLGEGGRKRVYLAHDEKLDRDVAVAVIKTEGLDEAGLARVQREAQAMGRLGDHPNIVTIHDIGDDEGQPYIVSQFMAGGDLAFALDQREDHRYPMDVVVRVADQVCAGLEHAHARGIVHRDLKPGNIWFDSAAVAKIGDFGLAVALDRSRLTMAGMMVGTASYMPPEQAMGGETTPASDLYALGCVVYEMVTGRPPFVGDDTVAVISQHVNTAPVSPAWHNPECPPGLEALIMRLLQKDRKQRPANASDVREALAALSRGSTPAPQPAPAAPAEQPANPIYRRTFVGREQELKQLEGAFDAALSGQGSLVMIVGEPGIGKTTITEQLSTYVGMRGGKTLVGHCYEEGSLSLPYLAFVEAMRTYVVEHDREQLSQELGPGAADVARIVSEVRDRVNVAPSPSGSPEEERFRLFQAVTGFLRNASNVQALCIILEDLHDADKGTMEMLVHLGRNLTGARIFVVGTYRDVEVDRTHPLSAALAELRRAESFARIPLRGLSPAEVRRMLSNIAGQEVLYELAEAVYRQTEGNPLFIQEVIRYAAESGLIKREGGQWVASVDSLITQIPEGLRDVIGRRLSGLSEECNRILSIASVIGRDFAIDVLREVAGGSEDDLLAALEEATRVSLIEEMRGQRELRYRFTHAFFRQTLYEEMIAPRRLRMHNEVAKALEQHYAGHVEEHAAELAEHFSYSSTEEDLQKAVTYGKLAAERAAKVHAYGEAVRHLEQALEVQDVLNPRDGVARLPLLAELAATLLAAGEANRLITDVAPRACELAESMGETTIAARIAEAAAYAMILRDSLLSFVNPLYSEWCERIRKNATPGSRERVMGDGLLSWAPWAMRDPARCWDLRRSALDTARHLDDPEALGYAAFCFMQPGAPMRFFEERLSLAQEMRSAPSTQFAPNLRAQYLYSLGQVLFQMQDIDAFQRSWDELDELAHLVPDPYVQAWQLLAVVVRKTFAGKLEEAVEAAHAAIAQGRDASADAFALTLSRVVSSGPLGLLGRWDELAVTYPFWRTLNYGDAVVAYHMAQAGQLNEAHQEMERLISQWRIGEADSWVDENSLGGLLAVATMTADREAAALLYPLVEPAQKFHSLNYGAYALHLGTAATLLDDLPAARRHLETSLRVNLAGSDAAGVVMSRLELARFLFDHSPEEKRAAAEHLNLATQEAQAMKMTPLLEDCLALKLQAQGISSTDIYTSIDRVASAVESQHPDLKKHAAPDGTVTIMFSDIEGSTEKTDRLGDKAWMDVLREHNAIVREQLKAFGGFEVKSEGDGFMVAFQSAIKALECAAAIQAALAARNNGAAEPIRVRMGLHAGEVIREGEDFFGRNVIMAARVASEANGGEILASSVIKALLAGSDIAWGGSRTVELKGLPGEHEIWAVSWA
jgi:class 3 adenylate cyclase